MAGAPFNPSAARGGKTLDVVFVVIAITIVILSSSGGQDAPITITSKITSTSEELRCRPGPPELAPLVPVLLC